MRAKTFSHSAETRAARTAPAVLTPILGTESKSDFEAAKTPPGDPNASIRRMAVIEPISGIEHNFIYDFQSSTTLKLQILIFFIFFKDAGFCKKLFFRMGRNPQRK